MPLPTRQEINPLGTMDVVQVKAGPDTGIAPVDQTALKDRNATVQAVGSVLGNWAQKFNKEGEETAFLDGVRQEALIGANAAANRVLGSPNMWSDAFNKGVQKAAASLMPQRVDEQLNTMAQTALENNDHPRAFAQKAQKHIETELDRFKGMPDVDPASIIHVAERGMSALDKGIGEYGRAFVKKQEAIQTAGVIKEQTNSLAGLGAVLNDPVKFGKQFGEDYFKTLQNTSYMKPDKIEQLSAYYLDQVANVIENTQSTYEAKLAATQQYMSLIKELQPELQGKVDPAVKRIMSKVQGWNDYAVSASISNAEAVLNDHGDFLSVFQRNPVFKDVPGTDSVIGLVRVIKQKVASGAVLPAAGKTIEDRLWGLQEKANRPVADKPLEIIVAAVPGDGSEFSAKVIPENVAALVSTPQGVERVVSEISDATSKSKFFGSANNTIQNYGLNTTLSIVEASLPSGVKNSAGWNMVRGKIVDQEFSLMKAALSDPNTLVNSGGYLTWMQQQLQNPAIAASIPDTPLNNQVRAALNAAASDPKIQQMSIGTPEEKAAKHMTLSKAFAERWTANQASTAGLVRTVNAEYFNESAKAIANKRPWYYFGMGRGSASDKQVATNSMAALSKEYYAQQVVTGKTLTQDDVDNVNARMQVPTSVGVVLLPPSMIDGLGVSGTDDKVVESFHGFLKQVLGLSAAEFSSLKDGKLVQRDAAGSQRLLDARVFTDVNTKQYVLQTKSPDAVSWDVRTIGSMQAFQTYASNEFSKAKAEYSAESFTKQGLNGPVRITLDPKTANRDALLYTPVNVTLPIGADSASQARLLEQYSSTVGASTQGSRTLLANTMKQQGVSDNNWKVYEQRLGSIGLMLQQKGVDPAKVSTLLDALQTQLVKSWSAKDQTYRGLVTGKASQDVLNALAHSKSVGERPALRQWYRQQTDALDLIVRTHKASKLK